VMPSVFASGAGPVGRAAGPVERLYGSPWGWIANLADGTLWNYSEQNQRWERWNVALVIPDRQGSNRPAKTTAPSKPVSFSGGPLAFSAHSAFLSVKEGLLRCDAEKKCAPLPAFSRLSPITAIWSSVDENFLAVASEGKLGISGDAGRSARWRSLPAGVRKISWLSASPLQPAEIFLGTDQGLYFSSDAGEHWELVREGLPTASIGDGLRIGSGLLVTLQQGGIFYSSGGRDRWERLDRDAERSRINGVVQSQTGTVLFGSQSEGILEWQPAKPYR